MGTQAKRTIVLEVRLTPAQKIALMEASNRGGKLCAIDHGVRVTLQHLLLIEEREALSPVEKRVLVAKISVAWKEAAALLRKKDADGLDRKMDSIRGWMRSLESKAWWLTKAADIYLAKGKVTIE